MLDDNQIEISKTIEYEIENEEGEIEKNKFILIANEEMLNTLKNNLIEEYFIDATYSCVPPSKPKFKLLVLSGFDIENKTTVLSAFILVTNEKIDTFIKIFQYLKTNYQFNPKNIMADFRISQIKAIQKVFQRCNIHCCFFHFSQSIWRNFKKNGLCGKGTYITNYELLINIQCLCFISKEKINDMFNNIKKKYKSEKYKKFFSYFTKTWLGNKIPNTLWNFNDLLSNPNNVTFFHLTNNITENINRYLNIKLKKAFCSNYLFRESILDNITQFKLKTSNTTF